WVDWYFVVNAANFGIRRKTSYKRVGCVRFAQPARCDLQSRSYGDGVVAGYVLLSFFSQL
ncbi:MAG: hypothetical protein JXA82_06495, partial [Sedimentisphaerales bacterium]|nr:hypothetical protein [Sedimentisphaerales bacterium]